MLKNSDLVGAGPKLLALTIRIFKWNPTRDITSLKFRHYITEVSQRLGIWSTPHKGMY